jgi:hypothetical protein
VTDVSTAHQLFSKAATNIGEFIDLLSPAETIQVGAAGTETWRPYMPTEPLENRNAAPTVRDAAGGSNEC